MKIGADALRPHLQLFDSSRAEGIRRRNKYLLSLHTGAIGQLRNGGRLAYAINPHHEDHFRRIHRAYPAGRTEQRLNLFLKQRQKSCRRS